MLTTNEEGDKEPMSTCGFTHCAGEFIHWDGGGYRVQLLREILLRGLDGVPPCDSARLVGGVSKLAGDLLDAVQQTGAIVDEFTGAPSASIQLTHEVVKGCVKVEGFVKVRHG